MSTQLWFVVLVFASCAAQPPEWPPATRVSVTPVPEPEVFQPVRSLSKPPFLTKSTLSVAELVLPASLPVTVCGPPALGVQVLPLHVPSGLIENVVAEVTLPSELLNESNPCAV